MIDAVMTAEPYERRTTSKSFFSLIGPIDKDGIGPLHERLYQRIRRLILTGTITRGTRLPSSRALAQGLGISRNSVLLAFDRLIADGWIDPRRGSGVYVSYAGVPIKAGNAETTAGGEHVPFELGLAPQELFPWRIWSRIQARRWKSIAKMAFLQGDPNGLPELREAISVHLAATRGLRCSPDQVFVTTSTLAGIDLTVRAMDLLGAETIVEDPGYNGTRHALYKRGVRLVPVPLDRSGIDTRRFAELAPHAKVAVVTPACQFPTCTELAPDRRDALLRWAAENQAWIIEDDFDWQSAELESPLPLAARDPARTIYLSCFNQVLFPALCIGCVVAPESLTDRFAAVRAGLDGYSNVPNQIVLADFIHGGHLGDHLRNTKPVYAERRATFVRAVEGPCAATLTPLIRNVGSHVVCDLNGFTESAFVARCAALGITVLPAGPQRFFDSGPPQILFGCAGFTSKAMEDAAKKLIAACARA